VWAEFLQPVFWGTATLVCYFLARALNARHAAWWTSPLLVTWLLCLTLALALHATYGTYLIGTRWLGALLGPATMAFAMPIYEQRQLIRRHWPVLAIGVAAGLMLAVGSSWLFARVLGLDPLLRTSLLPRSISTPFALDIARKVGAAPELTATFVLVTGLLGASLGTVILKYLPLRSAFARGAMFGMGAHGVGTAKARELGQVEGSVAGLTMILAGLISVLAAPLLALCLR